MKRIQHSRQSGGFSLFEAIIVSVVLAVLIALLLPRLARPKRKSASIACGNNLKQIGLAFSQWSMDNNDKYPMQVSVTDGGTMEWVGSGTVYVHFLVLSNELNTPMLLFCPQESNPKRHRATRFDAAVPSSPGQIPFTNDNNVSYFVGVDASPDNPAMFLSGDANLAVGGKPTKPGLLSLWTNSPVAWAKPRRPYHDEGGNILLVDGSAGHAGNVRLRELLTESGVATNRLAIP